MYDDAEDNATATLFREMGPPRPIGAIIRVLDVPAKPATFRLTADHACVLGAAPTSDVVIESPGVSRSHAKVEIVREGITITDLGSRNGTWYLGQRVGQMTLALGARVKIGDTVVVFDADNDALKGALHPASSFRGMVGASAAMRRVFASLARLEGSLVTVLVTGESGVGKELIARALHEGSSVAKGELVVVNCGAIPRELIASELFGHLKGSFTGAQNARKGAFELADQGTLFLDEVGELPLDVQPVLLRALETGDIRPVGSETTKQVRVRVVAATNRDLEEEVKAGRFREDLFYRLAVVRLKIPALRERPEDIEGLARQFASLIGLAEIDPVVIEELKARAWPGNVRELRNVVQAYAALGSLPEHAGSTSTALEMALGDLVDVTRPYGAQKEELAERFTRIYLQALMAHTAGNQSAAAKLASLDRTYLGKLLVKHNLSKT